jgi:hypothetical protein
MNLQFSYHPWCQGTCAHYHQIFVLINFLHLEANSLTRHGNTNIIIPTNFENGTRLKWLSWGGLVKILLSKIEWHYVCRPSIKIHTHVQTWKTYMWEFQNWSSYAYYEGGQRSLTNDGCLTYWTWMPSLEHVCFRLLP